MDEMDAIARQAVAICTYCHITWPLDGPFGYFAHVLRHHAHSPEGGAIRQVLNARALREASPTLLRG
jgi:hypothetical protein